MQRQWDEPLFTIWINGDTTAEATGELTMGAINPKYYTGPLVQIPVNSPVCRLVWRMQSHSPAAHDHATRLRIPARLQAGPAQLFCGRRQSSQHGCSRPACSLGWKNPLQQTPMFCSSMLSMRSGP